MNRETVILNLVKNYGKCGVSREMLELMIDDGIEEGYTYDFIYLTLKAEFCRLVGEEFICTSDEAARAFGVSVEELENSIVGFRDELAEQGKNPDDYFKPVQASRYFV